MDKILDQVHWKVILALFGVLLMVVGGVTFIAFRGQTNLGMFKGQQFSVSFPKEVVANTATIFGGGQALVFNLPQDQNYSMDLEIVPSTVTNNAQIIYNIFRILSYAETDIKIKNQPGKEFSGSTIIGAQTLQEKAAIIENKGQIYKLHLAYYASQRDTEADDLFSQVLSSLKFN